MPATIQLADYLFRRLRQLGVGSVHGVPGDFNLTLLDHVEPAGLRWVGNANELNAAYAADGYSRIKGIGAVITTFGVGELSAINAIGGAFAERAPVVHIVGTPPRNSQDSRHPHHHTLNDGEYRHFSQMYSHVTVAQTHLWDTRTSASQVDEALRQCLLHSRPVYIEIPVDMVSALVSEDRLSQPIEPLDTTFDAAAHDAVLQSILGKIAAAKQPIIYVDGEIRPLGIVDEVQKFVDATNWPTWVVPFGKGFVNETAPNFHGVYDGAYDRPEVQSFVNGADLIVCFGPHFSSTNTSLLTGLPNPEVTISFSDAKITIGKEIHRDITAKSIVSSLLESLDVSKIQRYDPYPELPRQYNLSLADVSPEAPLTQDRLWRTLSNFFRPGDIVMGETGTSGYGVRYMPLPENTRLFTHVTWLSIGYMLPAAQGAALAQEELAASPGFKGVQGGRTILFIGDGSFQMTAQELATIIYHNLNVVVFLLNNDGYTIERCIHGYKAGYNGVPRWRYLQAPSFFGASEDTFTVSTKTWGELGQALTDDRLINGKGLRMVELVVDREDAPPGPLMQLLDKQRNADGA